MFSLVLNFKTMQNQQLAIKSYQQAIHQKVLSMKLILILRILVFDQSPVIGNEAELVISQVPIDGDEIHSVISYIEII